MAGYVIPIVSKRLIDFSSLQSGTLDVILEDRVNLIHWRELTVQVHVHDRNVGAAAGSVTVGVQGVSWSSAEPDLTFLAGTYLLDPITSATPTACILSAALSTSGVGCFGNMARILARGSRSGAGSLSATISVELSVKDR